MILVFLLIIVVTASPYVTVRNAQEIIVHATRLLRGQPTILDIPAPTSPGARVTIVGDTHGQFSDVLRIFQINGEPSETNMYIFNGDMVDRGPQSLELILTLFTWKLKFPNHVHLLRGNHETLQMNEHYGFKEEVLRKANLKTFRLLTESFNALPLGAVLGNKVFICHGGLFSRDGVTLSELNAIDRHMQPPHSGLMTELLWSDPQTENGRGPNPRGTGTLNFGPDVTAKFLSDNGLDLVIRSHQVKMGGYEVEHDGKLITVFSAPNYMERMKNKGALVIFDQRMVPMFQTF